MPNVQMPNGDVVAFPDDMPREQIKGLIASKFPDVVKAQPQQPKTGKIEAALMGAAENAPFGFGNEIMSGLTAAGAAVAGTLAQPFTDQKLPSYGDIPALYSKELAKSNQELQQAQEDQPLSYLGGSVAGALGTGLAGAGTKGGAAITNWVRTGGLPARIAKGVATGAASGATYGAGNAEEGKRLEGAKTGAMYGGVAGGVLPVAGAVGSAAKSAVVPYVDDAIKPLANRAKELGIPLRVDQISPTRFRKTVQKVSQEIPLSGVEGFENTQKSAFNRAIARTIGQDTDNLSPETINSFLKESSNKFASVLNGKMVNASGISKRLDDIVKNAQDNITGEYADLVARKAAQIKTDIGGSVVQGSKLSSLRSNLVNNLPKMSGDARQYVADMIDAIDDVAKTALNNKDTLKLAQARREWRNYRTIEPLLEKATDGNINPTDLMNRVAGSKFIKASRNEVGKDDLVDLARIGKQFLPKAGGSDTFQKTALGGAGVAALYEPATLAATGGAMLGNRAFQGAYNTSQRVVDAALKRARPVSGGTMGALSAPAGAAAGAIGAEQRTINNTITPQLPAGGNNAPVLSPRSDVAPFSGEPPVEQSANTLLDRIAQAESGGDPNAKAKTSSASGLFQFTDGTWREMVRKYGQEYGVTVKDKNDPEAQRVMAELLTQENSRALRNHLGRDPSDGELYLAHFAGARGAKKLLTANPRMTAAMVLPDAAKANRTIFYNGGKPRTVAEVVSLLKQKVEEA